MGYTHTHTLTYRKRGREEVHRKSHTQTHTQTQNKTYTHVVENEIGQGSSPLRNANLTGSNDRALRAEREGKSSYLNVEIETHCNLPLSLCCYLVFVYPRNWRTRASLENCRFDRGPGRIREGKAAVQATVYGVARKWAMRSIAWKISLLLMV